MNQNPETKTQHSPLPLHIGFGLDGDGAFYVRDGTGEDLCKFDSNSSERDEANAALIVRAVNSHAELLAALKAIHQRTEGHSYAMGQDIAAIASAAIAKAGGAL